MQKTTSIFTSALLPIGAALAIALGGAAWACTAQAQITLLPASGPPDSQIAITGSGFNAEPVQIRWNSPKGPVLGTADGPRFSTWVKVPPSASRNVYYVVAVQGQYKATQSFEVKRRAVWGAESAGPAGSERAARSLSNDLWSGLRARAGLPEQPAALQGETSRKLLAGTLVVAGLSGVVAVLGLTVLARRRALNHDHAGPQKRKRLF